MRALAVGGGPWTDNAVEFVEYRAFAPCGGFGDAAALKGAWSAAPFAGGRGPAAVSAAQPGQAPRTRSKIGPPIPQAAISRLNSQACARPCHSHFVGYNRG